MSIEVGRALLFALVLTPGIACAEGSSTPVPEVAADSIVLFEMDSGTVGYRDVAAGPPGDLLVDLRPTEPKIESITTSAYLGPIPLVAPCADGSVLLFQPSRGRLERLGGDGRVLSSDSLSLPRRPLGPDDLRPFLDLFLEWELRRTQQTIAAAERTRMIDQLLARGSEMFSPIASFAVSMMCDTEGRAWLQGFSTADHPVGYGRRWRVYDRGTLTAVIALPAGFQRV